MCLKYGLTIVIHTVRNNTGQANGLILYKEKIARASTSKVQKSTLKSIQELNSGNLFYF